MRIQKGNLVVMFLHKLQQCFFNSIKQAKYVANNLKWQCKPYCWGIIQIASEVALANKLMVAKRANNNAFTRVKQEVYRFRKWV